MSPKRNFRRVAPSPRQTWTGRLPAVPAPMAAKKRAFGSGKEKWGLPRKKPKETKKVKTTAVKKDSKGIQKTQRESKTDKMMVLKSCKKMQKRKRIRMRSEAAQRHYASKALRPALHQQPRRGAPAATPAHTHTHFRVAIQKTRKPPRKRRLARLKTFRRTI